MNENVWDPVMAWQALLPGSGQSAQRSFRKLTCWLLNFLQQRLSLRLGSQLPIGPWPRPEKLVSATSHMRTLTTKLSGHSRPQSVFLPYPPSLSMRKKMKSAALLSWVLPSAVFQDELTMDTWPVGAHLWAPGMAIMLCDCCYGSE